MECYGRSYNKLDKCKDCEFRSFCQDAADLKASHSQYNDDIKSDVSISDLPKSFVEQEAYNEEMSLRENTRYTLDEMIALIRKLLEMDPLILEYVRMKITNPAITLEQMAIERELLEREKRNLAVNRLSYTLEALCGVNIARGDAKKKFMKLLEEKPISREGVNKMLIKACKEHPELELILRNRKHRKQHEYESNS